MRKMIFSLLVVLGVLLLASCGSDDDAPAGDAGASALSIYTNQLPNGNMGVSYDRALVASGGTPPYTWSIVSGTLPAGLNFDSNAGLINGTPAEKGTFSFTCMVEDAALSSLTRVLTLSVTENLSITTASLPQGSEGVAYSASLTVASGTAPYTWSIVSGALPAGLNFDSNAGLISGTPAATGAYTFTVMVQDSSLLSVTKGFSITISDLLVTTVLLPDGSEGNPYSCVLDASGGGPTPIYTWSIDAGALPPGLALDADYGVISGAPTLKGKFDFVVKVTDLYGSYATKFLTIRISDLAITMVSLPQGSQGVVYSTSLTAAGGTAPYTWSIVSGVLPTGLAINANTGEIYGTPSAVGTYTFTVMVQDSSLLSVTRVFSITVSDLVITTSSVPDGCIGVAFNYKLFASGGSTDPIYTWSIDAGTLPPGLDLDQDTGVMRGVPAELGMFNFIVRATDLEGAYATKFYSITISYFTFLTASPLPQGSSWVPYGTTLEVEGGVAPYLWSSFDLPPWLNLGPSTTSSVDIGGTPMGAGQYTFTVMVGDNSGLVIAKEFSLTVTDLVITTVSMPDCSLNTPYDALLEAVGGGAYPIYTWSIDAGVLPTGLALNPDTGVISGTPTEMGTFNFMVKVADTAGATDTKFFSIIIGDLNITTESPLPPLSSGVAYMTTLNVAGGTAPYSWAAPGLPVGLVIYPPTGEINGTTSVLGTTTFKATVTDSGSPALTVSKVFSIMVTDVSITTTGPLPGGAIGISYSFTLEATGGTSIYNWSIDAGILPTGLTINPNTGVISGTPTEMGTFNFIVRVTSSDGGYATKFFSITI